MSSNNDQGSPGTSDARRHDPPPSLPSPETRVMTILNWLKRIYIDHSHLGSSLALTMDDFVKIVAPRKATYNHYWLEDNALVLALIFLTNSLEKQNEVLIVPSNAAIGLDRVGRCLTDKNQFMAHDYSRKCYDAMKKESIRWVVVPVTSGMGRQRNANVIPGGGMHWGLMIIDKQRNDARWLDGHLTLKRKPDKKWGIQFMYKGPAEVAGKILCGYEKVMDLERGRFTAATLKHVPHDTDDNVYKGDGNSACGPWVFAILEYILKNPSLLTNENGLHGAFRRRKVAYHKEKMSFNSLSTRKYMQEMIRSVADENLGEDELPFKMTVRILKLLNLPSTADLVGRCSSITEPRSGSGGNGGPSKGPGDDEDDDKDDNNNPDDKRWDLQKAIEESFNMNKNAAAQGASNIHDTGSLIVPDGLTMPKDFGNSKEVDKTALERWKEANETALEYLIPRNKKEEANDTSYRAVLHILSGHNFDTESDDRMRDIWGYDSNALNQLAKDQFSTEAIRTCMTNAYITAKRKRTDGDSEGRVTKRSKGEAGGSGSQTKKRRRSPPNPPQ